MRTENVAIILHYRQPTFCCRLLAKIVSYQTLNHIVVVDNASNDGSFEMIKKQFDANLKIVFLSSDKNLGYPKGNNLGLRYAQTHFNPAMYLVVNPDVLFEEKLIGEAKDYFAKDKTCTTLAFRQVSLTGEAMPCRWDKPKSYHADFVSLSPFNRKVKNNLPTQNIEFPFRVSGAFFFADAAKFEAIDFFDEGTFLNGEEQILAFRIQRAGYHEALIGTDSFIHDHQAHRKEGMSYWRQVSTTIDSMVYTWRHYSKLNIFQRLDLSFLKTFKKVEYFCYCHLSDLHHKLKR
jgi:GT2 family glycosyltransferase